MWRRQRNAEPGAGRENGTGREHGAQGQPGPLGAGDDLLRRAEWEGLADAERAALLGAYKTLDAPTTGGQFTTSPRVDDLQTQDWVAGLVTRCFQPEAVVAVRDWLAQAPPDAHLFVGGRPAQGRTSLVASLARQAMASRPTPPDYCYAPDASSLDTPVLLTLPHGTGLPFVKALGGALSAIATGWEDTAKAASGGTPEAALQQLVAAQMGPVAANAPEGARDYLTALRATLDAATGDPGTVPLATDDLPLGEVSPTSDPPAEADGAGGGAAPGMGAPVVVASLVDTELADAVLRANGGVLILGTNNLNFDNLAQLLRTRTMTVKAGWTPVPLDVKVMLVGTEEAYGNLYSDDFAHLFRREVWCNGITDWTREAEGTYAALADGATRRSGLPPFDPSGVARLIEEGARRSGGLNRSRLSTDLLVLHDLAVEAGQAAKAQGAATTAGTHVLAALARRRMLQGANARWVLQAILSGEEITPTTGSALGQINGLGIYEWHPYEASFAVPMRISATVSPGRDEQLVDIERESSQADADHVRGAMTMEGYLADRYARERPLHVVARVRFEQEHGATGGDSASAAVLFTLLSALAQAPIRCSLAVTGAVGQYGEIQPIGGVNTKIEGFWELCRARRAEGEQSPEGYGVLIPAINARDLMLRRDVAESIASEGWFRVYPIGTVDDALPLLTGIPAAEIHRRVEQRLKQFFELSVRGGGR